MVVESPEQVAKFLHLQSLSIEELQLQSEDINKEQKSKAFLIEKILKKDTPEIESQGILPQGIPLRSKYKNGKVIPKTAKTYQNWRKLIFQTENNLKDFDLINKENKQYSAKVYYIKCSLNTARYLIENKWFSPYLTQKELINQIKVNSEQFHYNIIRKCAANGNNFLMLHCEEKEK